MYKFVFDNIEFNNPIYFKETKLMESRGNMKLELSYIKSVLNIYDEMIANGASLVYFGEFNHEITKMFTSMKESDMERSGEEKKTKRRVYHVMVETLQNMNKHSDEISNQTIGNGLFMIGEREGNYFVITSNKVQNDKIEGLEAAIKEVNDATPDELKQMHKKQMREGRLSNKGGAGLGLIDIARKTENKLQYQFLPFDDEGSLFILKVDVTARAKEK